VRILPTQTVRLFMSRKVANFIVFRFSVRLVLNRVQNVIIQVCISLASLHVLATDLRTWNLNWLEYSHYLAKSTSSQSLFPLDFLLL
jgi:hypothetical protein